MAVDQIIMYALGNCKILDKMGKLGDKRSQFLLGKRHFGPSRHMHHPVPITQIVQNMGNMLILRTREHIDAHAFLAQVAGEFTHINIHPPCIFTAQGCQRTGMI